MPKNKTKKGFSRNEIIISVVIILLFIGLNIFLSGFFKNSVYDLTSISEITRLKSGMDLYYSYNSIYPVSEEIIKLNHDYSATQKLCADGFYKLTDICDKELVERMPHSKLTGGQYSYQTDAEGVGYQIEFLLTQNHKTLNLVKGANCLQDGMLIPQPCQFVEADLAVIDDEDLEDEE